MRDMKRSRSVAFWAVISAAFITQSACAGALRIPGQWLTIPRPSGGRPEDFSRSLTSHLFEDGMMVGLGNDADSLYVFFTPDMRRGPMRPPGARLTIWLDVRGGKARRLALEHVVRAGPGPGLEPGAGMPGEEAGAPPPGPTPQRDREFLKVIDRARGRQAFIAVDGSQGPALRLDSGWGDFTYQLRIPFRPHGDWPGLDVKPGQTVAVGFDWHAERRRGSSGGGMERPRGAPGGGGPGMGGMPPGGAMGTDVPPGSAPFDRRRAWVRTNIAAR